MTKRNTIISLFVFLAIVLLAYGSILSSYAEDALTGKVIETMDSGGYTYAQIENNGKKTWVAVPLAKFIKGQKISFAPGREMLDFWSKTLNRSFDRVIFSGGIIDATDKGRPTGTTGPKIYTIEEIHKNSDKLENEEITVKGKVVKFVTGIMKKNWIHIQDGSGSAKTGNHDLIITSSDLPTIGDVVIATGTLHNNKDFGDDIVIIENASIKK
jgi:hypothetical protein